MSQNQSQTITVARALVDLKLTHAKVISKIKGTTFVAAAKGSDAPRGFKTVAEFNNHATENLQSIKDLIGYYRKLKRAVIMSNAGADPAIEPTRLVEIAKEKMTVAEAIERKSSIEMEQLLFTTIKQQYGGASVQVERENAGVQQRVDQLLTATLGNADAIKKADVNTLTAITGPYEANNKFVLLDPVEAQKTFTKLEEELAEFLAQVDYTLSEANATTVITIQ